MGSNSGIEWCHHTSNPWWGCTKIDDLGVLKDDTAEAPLEFSGLAEKLIDLTNEQAAAIIWFVQSFLAGFRQARKAQE